jgi:hypothetical protein
MKMFLPYGERRTKKRTNEEHVMKKVLTYIALVVILGAATPRAQTLTKDAVLVGGDGDRITLGAPASVDAHKLLLPGTLGVTNSLLFITSVGGSTVSTSWIPPGNTGDVLAYVGGSLTWTPVASLPALTFWSLLGNSNVIVDGTNNLLGTTTAAPLRLITGSGGPNTRILISAAGDVTVNGTAGTSNVSMTSLGAATGTTGRVMFATDATGALQALAYPASSGQILTSTTGGVLSWTSSPTLNFWSLSGNSITTGGTGVGENFVGTTNTQPLVLATTNTTTPQNMLFLTNNTERMRLNSTGELGIGTTATAGYRLHVAGTSGTENVRLASLASATTAVDGGVVYADAQGDLNRLAAPGTNNFVLTSETDGTLIWQNANSLVTSGGIHEEASAGSDNIRRKAAYITGTSPTVGGTGSNDFQHDRNASGQTATGSRSTITGGRKNTASGETSAIVNGDTVVASGKYSLIGNGNANFATNEGTTVLNGFANYATGTYATILGGTGLTLSNQFAVGYNGATSTGTPLAASVSAGNVFYLGNVDLWLGNTRNQASQIRFYEAQSGTGTFPGGSTNYSSFQAGSQSADFNYTLPTTIPSAGQVLTASAVSAPAVTLSWTTPGAGSNWTLTGNSGTTAGTNFIGTTDAVDWVIKTGGSAAGNERARVTSGGRIGIGNISDVRTTVDINGDYATRYGSLALSNGVNNDINPGAYSYVRLTGPTADFSITGMRTGSNGKRITLYNTSSYTMTVKHENASSTDTARFYNPIATDLTIYSGGTLSLIYDGVQNRWIVAAYSNGFVPQISSMILRRKAANETLNTSTTFQDDDHLQWPVTAGQIWEVRGTIFVTQTSATPDFKFQFLAPGGAGDSLTLFYKMFKIQGGGGGTLNESAILSGYSTSSGNLSMNANTYAIDMSGVFVVGNASGNIVLQWAQNTSDPTNIQVDKNSYLFITRIQ